MQTGKKRVENARYVCTCVGDLLHDVKDLNKQLKNQEKRKEKRMNGEAQQIKIRLDNGHTRESSEKRCLIGAMAASKSKSTQ